jgi:NADPH-dependent 2,4-dienoyl-CoA reductase/sulfur reductase-like enzyme
VSETAKPRVAILGAGPTGLEAALAAAEAGFPFTVYEAAPEPGGNVRTWGHVRLFTPWDLDVSPRMRRHLAAAGREAEGDPLPERARLETTAAKLAAGASPHVEVRRGVAVEALEPATA